MGSALPIGDPAPADGLLPASARLGAEARAFGVYLHVPFCRVRCGYCDFNTYTATELRGARQDSYAAQASTELAFARAALDASGVPRREASTVFVGGGTPTLLPVTDLASMLRAVRKAWGIADGAEVTTEANPDSIDRDGLARLAEAGFTRVSVGMQSAVPSVLATLDRTHDPDRVPLVVGWAREAGLDVSLDLIYGAPGETMAEWQLSVDAAVASAPDHLSAYALIVEDGTKLARQIRRGELPEPDDDLEADKYEWLDHRMLASGYRWYELSNWARPGHESRHNLAYWTGEDWWGIGPGAHSHVGGVRWWNVRHPAAYGQRIAAGVSPAAGREVVGAEARHEERVLLETRLAGGMSVVDSGAALDVVDALVADGLIDAAAAAADAPRIVLSLRGRMLADAVVRRLLGQ